ncbi:hypothetical protein [Nocardioides aquiterrae]
MNIARKIAVAVVTATLSLGLVAVTAPAHADSTWGLRPPGGR